MLKDLKDVLNRSADTMIEDAFGAVSLFAILIMGLALPGLV